MLKKLFKKTAVTLLELMIVVGIFFLFLIAFYATMDVGLKQWKIGEVRSDLQTTGEWVMRRMVSELQNSSSVAIYATYDPADPNDTTCLVFETPIFNSSVQSSSTTGDLYWQGHILYYTLSDPSDTEYDTKILYRRFVPHSATLPVTDRTAATLLDDATTASYLNITPPASPGTFRVVCDSLTRVCFEHNGCIVNIQMEFMENIRKSDDARVSFQTGHDLGTDRFVLKNSIKPKN